MAGNNKINMTEGPILGNLLKFSIPVILSNILQLLFNAADVAVVGHFAGDASLAAVGSTSSLVNLLVNLFIGLSIGTNVVVAKEFGAKNTDKIQKAIHTSILLSVVSGLIITILGLFLSKQILMWMHSPEDVLPKASLYLKIYFSGITATMIYNFGSSILRAKGDTKRPLYILLSAGLLNLILNLIFVIKFKMDVAGVAWATVISQSYSAIFVLILLVKETDEFHLSVKKLTFHFKTLTEIIKIGLPAGLQGIMFSISNLLIQSSINSFGTIVIAGNSAACSIEDFLYQIMNGFSTGTLTFCSQNIGAGKIDRIKKEVWISLICTAFAGLFCGGLFILFGTQLLKIYTTNPDVITAGLQRMYITYTTIFICGMMHGYANAIRGIGHSVMPLISTMLGCCVFRVVWIYTIFQIPQFHTISSIYVSYPISWIITAGSNFIYYCWYMKGYKKGK